MCVCMYSLKSSAVSPVSIETVHTELNHVYHSFIVRKKAKMSLIV